MIVVPIFLWAGHFTGWAILGNGQVEFAGWQINLLGGQMLTPS